MRGDNEVGLSSRVLEAPSHLDSVAPTGWPSRTGGCVTCLVGHLRPDKDTCDPLVSKRKSSRQRGKVSAPLTRLPLGR